MGDGVGARHTESTASAARSKAASSAGIRHCPLGLGDLEAAVRSDAAYGAGIRELEGGSWRHGRTCQFPKHESRRSQEGS